MYFEHKSALNLEIHPSKLWEFYQNKQSEYRNNFHQFKD